MHDKRTFYIALGGVIAALSMVLMVLAIIPSTEIAMPAIAGILLIPVAIEAGSRWAFCIYGAVSILAVVFGWQKDAAIYYVTFFGHYPVLKKYIESIPARWLQWVVKVAVFNVCMAAAFMLGIFFTGLSLDSIKIALPLFVLLLNITFVIYDYAVTRLIVTYASRVRKHLRFKI